MSYNVRHMNTMTNATYKKQHHYEKINKNESGQLLQESKKVGIAVPREHGRSYYLSWDTTSGKEYILKWYVYGPVADIIGPEDHTE